MHVYMIIHICPMYVCMYVCMYLCSMRYAQTPIWIHLTATWKNKWKVSTVFNG